MHNTWCSSFQFVTSEKGTCKLFDDCKVSPPCLPFDDCSQQRTTMQLSASYEKAMARSVVSALPSALAKTVKAEIQASHRADGSCLRIADTNFDSWFVGYNPSRKARESDCNHACFNTSSVHFTWCGGFEFEAGTRTAGSTCRLYAWAGAMATTTYAECPRVSPVPAAQEALLARAKVWPSTSWGLQFMGIAIHGDSNSLG